MLSFQHHITSVALSLTIGLLVFSGSLYTTSCESQQIKEQRLNDLLNAIPELGWCSEGIASRSALMLDEIEVSGIQFKRQYSRNLGMGVLNNEFACESWRINVTGISTATGSEAYAVMFAGISSTGSPQGTSQEFPITNELILGRTSLAKVKRLLPTPTTRTEGDDAWNSASLHFERPLEDRNRTVIVSFDSNNVLVDLTLAMTPR